MSRARLFDTVLDATGRPVVGASVAVYEPGTATPIAETLYADDTGGTTLTNPLMTAADGSVLAYLDAGRRVDLYITSVGQTPRTVPDVGLFPDPADFTTDTDLGNHVGAADPHTGYATDTDLTTHAGAADPHTVYQKESEKGANNGYAGLGAGGLVPVAQLATGTPNGLKFYRDDGTLQVPAGATVTTTQGDTIKRGASADERLAIGTLGQKLTVTDIGSGVLEPRWATKAPVFVIGSTSGPTTTSTTYVDLAEMDTGNFTTYGGDILVWINSQVTNSGVAVVHLALSLDAAAEVADMQVAVASAAFPMFLSTFWLFIGVAAGTHRIKGRWKVGSGTGTALTTKRQMLTQEQ